MVCPCGVRDDDGERMAACDACAAWAHTRCAGTSDCDPVPRLFLCAACSAAGVLPLPGASPPPRVSYTPGQPQSSPQSALPVIKHCSTRSPAFTAALTCMRQPDWLQSSLCD